MKRLWMLLIIVFVTATVLFVTLSHHRPRAIESQPTSNSNRPERIVSLAPNLTEILFALGLDEKIIAVSSDSDWPQQAANKIKVGTFWQPNTEAVIASRPDLVVTLQIEQQRGAADSLSRLGYKVLTLKMEKTNQLLAEIQKIGVAAGCRQRADKLVEDISRRLNDLQSKYDSTDKVKVLWVMQAEPLRVAGRNTFINEMIEMAGGKNAIGPTIAKYPLIGTEQLLTCGAEVIIQSAMETGNISAQQRAAEKFWSRWANLPAVANGRIYVVEPDTVVRLGPRLPQGAEMIARCLHTAAKATQ